VKTGLTLRIHESMSVTKETVLEALRAVPGPNRTSDIVSLGLVSEIVVAGKDVMFAINVDPAEAGGLEPLRQAAERAVSGIPGIGKVMVALTAEKKGNGGAEGPSRNSRRAQAPAQAQAAAAGARAAACPASSTSWRWHRARAGSASRRPRSTWRSACRPWG
jgi:metal-sulfur cluster biosynthetic enzyme